MFYPEDEFKNNWDLFVTLILIFTCLVTPFNVAFDEVNERNIGWEIANNIVDFCFFVDIIFNFNSAFNDDDFKIIDDRKVIACSYLKGWFAIDFLAIVPLNYMVPASGEDGS